MSHQPFPSLHQIARIRCVRDSVCFHFYVGVMLLISHAYCVMPTVNAVRGMLPAI